MIKYRQRPIWQNDHDSQYSTAIHEAGHAVIRELCGGRIKRVSIIGNASDDGKTVSYVYGKNQKKHLLYIQDVMVAVAGGMAQEKQFAGSTCHAHVSGDYKAAKRDAKAYQVGEGKKIKKAFTKNMIQYAEYLVQEIFEEDYQGCWTAVLQLADELMVKKHVRTDTISRYTKPFFDTNFELIKEACG